jgi:tetratricopeptide (TPR) repeat protein
MGNHIDAHLRARVPSFYLLKGSSITRHCGQPYLLLVELTAKNYLDKAASEAKAAGEMPSSYRVNSAFNEGWLALEEGRFPEAVQAYEQSLSVCKTAYSQVLDLAGSHSEAAQVKKDAEQAMKDLNRFFFALHSLLLAGFRKGALAAILGSKLAGSFHRERSLAIHFPSVPSQPFATLLPMLRFSVELSRRGMPPA